MWSHDLLTSATLEARSSAVSQFNVFLSQAGLDHRCIIGIPCGSLYWIITERSDYDILVLTWTQSDAETINEAASSQFGRLSILNGAYPVKTDILIPRASALFLTPDEYIGGDVSFTRRTRLELMRRMPVKQLQLYWNRINHYLLTHFINWRNNRGSHTAEGITLTSTKRSDRYERMLSIEAAASSSPAQFAEGMTTFLDSLQFPDMAVIQEAILKSEGALSLK